VNELTVGAVVGAEGEVLQALEVELTAGEEVEGQSEQTREQEEHEALGPTQALGEPRPLGPPHPPPYSVGARSSPSSGSSVISCMSSQSGPYRLPLPAAASSGVSDSFVRAIVRWRGKAFSPLAPSSVEGMIYSGSSCLITSNNNGALIDAVKRLAGMFGRTRGAQSFLRSAALANDNIFRSARKYRVISHKSYYANFKKSRGRPTIERALKQTEDDSDLRNYGVL
jgi:hypothetical protein